MDIAGAFRKSLTEDSQGSSSSSSSSTSAGPTTSQNEASIVSQAPSRKRARDTDIGERSVEVQAKKSAAGEEFVSHALAKDTLHAIAKDTEKIDITLTETSIATKVMLNGGASDESMMIMEQLEQIITFAEVRLGFTYHLLAPKHKENFDFMMSWAKGKLAGLLSYFSSDSFLERGFQSVIIPMLQVSKDDKVDPESIEGVAINGLKSLEGKDIRYLLGKVRSLDCENAPACEDPFLNGLIRFLKNFTIDDDAEEQGLLCQTISADSFQQKDGIFALKGVGKLPNGQEKEGSIICIRNGSESAVIAMLALGEDGKDLTPVFINISSEVAEQTQNLLEAFGILDINQVTIKKISEA